MRVSVEQKSIKWLYENIETINLQPEYQRGGVWSKAKQELFLDSIFRGYDIPKIYLRCLSNNVFFSHQVADGQQRLTALKLFIKGDLKIAKEPSLEFYGVKINGQKFSNLSTNIKDKFYDMALTFSFIEEATSEEIRALFARLQMGVTLTPAEKRNAIASSLGSDIDNYVNNHRFFRHSRINAKRFCRQDFLAHAICLVKYGEKKPLKAPILLKMYEKYAKKSIDIDCIHTILDALHNLNLFCSKRIKTKWGFVDLFRLFYHHYEIDHDLNKINYKKFAKKYIYFEEVRTKYRKQPEKLIGSKNQELFKYIQAFNSSGAEVENFTARFDVMQHYFNSFFERAL